MRYRRTLTLILSIAALTAVHFAVSRTTHAQHVIHVVFGALYLLPAIGGAVWFGSRGGVWTSLGAGAAYSLHILHVWPEDHLQNVNGIATVVMIVVVGTVAGVLVDLQDRERRRGLAMERRARRAAIVQGLAGLSTALGFRDEYTRQHSERVADLAVQIGRVRELGSERLEMLRLAALVHDLGKIGVPDDILFKPDELTPDERAVIERHPAVAAEILSKIDGTQEIAAIVLSHHECPNGSGYPKGLVGDEILPEAAILRVADVFSALTDKRSYKSALDEERALSRMMALKETQFDRESLEALRTVLARQHAGTNHLGSTPSSHPEQEGTNG